MPCRPSISAERIHDVIERLFSGSSRWRSGGSCSWAQTSVPPSAPSTIASVVSVSPPSVVSVAVVSPVSAASVPSGALVLSSSLPQAAKINADAPATARSLTLRRVVFTYVSSWKMEWNREVMCCGNRPAVPAFNHG